MFDCFLASGYCRLDLPDIMVLLQFFGGSTNIKKTASIGRDTGTVTINRPR
jgi:hypothetical protein